MPQSKPITHLTHAPNTAFEIDVMFTPISVLEKPRASVRFQGHLSKGHAVSKWQSQHSSEVAGL